MVSLVHLAVNCFISSHFYTISLSIVNILNCEYIMDMGPNSIMIFTSKSFYFGSNIVSFFLVEINYIPCL